jgi:uncharacterized membrane protein
MLRAHKRQLAICSTGAFLTAMAAPAYAGLTVCNDSDLRQSVAIGYEAQGGVWTSEGWWRLPPGDCKVVMGKALGRSSFYYRATVKGGGFDGTFAFCTESDAFTILGDEDCEARGYERTRFRKVDTGGAEDFTLTLVSDLSDPAPAPTPAPEPDYHPEDDMVPWEISYPFERGSLGEPFTQYGIFYGCEIIDGAEYCSFEVEGWRYFAFYGSGADDSLLEELQSWPMPMAVEIEGDMINYGDITVEVALARVTELIDGDFWAGERQALQGTWQSVDDPRSSFSVVGGSVYDYYDGAFVGEQWMTIGETCLDSPMEGIGFTRLELETQDSWCVLLGDMGTDFIEFINPGRGNLLTYRRVD